MSSDEKMKMMNNRSRPITGLFGSLYTAQHAILTTFSLYLLLSTAIPSVGAQPTGTDTQYPYTKFSPSMAIIIVVLIAALFIMAFFSIYIRNCSNGGESVGVLAGISASMRGRRGAAAARGLDPEVIETFPTFAYSVVKGLKIGKGALECAVCLNEFEDDETLRLIPKCDHVFHPECIDEWLVSHVTCPVCRTNLVPQPGESPRVPNLEAAEPSHIALDVENTQNGDVSLPVIDDHDVNVPQPQVVDRNKSVNQNRPPRSRSVRARLFGKFPRSHSTGHSLVQPGENTDRFTLRLPEDVRKQVMNRALNRTKSCVDRSVLLPREGSSRRGYRTGGEGSSRGRRYRRLESLDRAAKSDRWVFSIAPPFLSRESSFRSPKVVAADGEGTSVSTVKTASNGLDRKNGDADSARPPV